MRKVLLPFSLVLGLLLLAPPAYAVSYTGEAWLNWNTLQISGIPIKTSFIFQQHLLTAFSDPGAGLFRNADFPAWRNHTVALSIPQVTTAVTNADSSRLYSAVTLFGSSVGQLGQADLLRSAFFTALDTGKLHISIDYSLRQFGVRDGLGANVDVALILARDVGEDVRSTASLPSAEGDGVRTGTLSLTQSIQRGEAWSFLASTDVAVGNLSSSVPLPDTLWPMLVGLIGLIFYVEWARRKLAS
jgi:hypothetical protein